MKDFDKEIKRAIKALKDKKVITAINILSAIAHMEWTHDEGNVYIGCLDNANLTQTNINGMNIVQETVNGKSKVWINGKPVNLEE